MYPILTDILHPDAITFFDSHDSDSDQLTSACTPPLSSPPFLSAAAPAPLL
jgi:hypothetical protein